MKEFVRIVNVLRICMSLQEFKRIRKNATCTSICKEFARFVKNCKKIAGICRQL